MTENSNNTKYTYFRHAAEFTLQQAKNIEQKKGIVIHCHAPEFCLAIDDLMTELLADKVITRASVNMSTIYRRNIPHSLELTVSANAEESTCVINANYEGDFLTYDVIDGNFRFVIAPRKDYELMEVQPTCYETRYIKAICPRGEGALPFACSQNVQLERVSSLLANPTRASMFLGRGDMGRKPYVVTFTELEEDTRQPAIRVAAHFTNGEYCNNISPFDWVARYEIEPGAVPGTHLIRAEDMKSFIKIMRQSYLMRIDDGAIRRYTRDYHIDDSPSDSWAMYKNIYGATQGYAIFANPNVDMDIFEKTSEKTTEDDKKTGETSPAAARKPLYHLKKDTADYDDDIMDELDIEPLFDFSDDKTQEATDK